VSRRRQNDFDEESNDEIEKLPYRLRFRHPNNRKRDRIADHEPSQKNKRNRPKYDETEYDEL
jgi:hypothetical protein